MNQSSAFLDLKEDSLRVKWSFESMVLGEWYPTDLVYEYKYTLNPPTNNAAYGPTKGLYVANYRFKGLPLVAQGIFWLWVLLMFVPYLIFQLLGLLVACFIPNGIRLWWFGPFELREGLRKMRSELRDSYVPSPGD